MFIVNVNSSLELVLKVIFRIDTIFNFISFFDDFDATYSFIFLVRRFSTLKFSTLISEFKNNKSYIYIHKRLDFHQNTIKNQNLKARTFRNLFTRVVLIILPILLKTPWSTFFAITSSPRNGIILKPPWIRISRGTRMGFRNLAYRTLSETF